MKKIGAILFLAGGIALVWFGWHGMQNPTATCGGEHMGSGDTCHYTGAGSSYTRDSADERNHNKFDSIFMMGLGGVLALGGTVGLFSKS